MRIYATNRRDRLNLEWSGYSGGRAFIKRNGTIVASFDGDILKGTSERYIGNTNSEYGVGYDYALITDKGSTRQSYFFTENGDSWDARGGLPMTSTPPYLPGIEKAVFADINGDGIIQGTANFRIHNDTVKEGDTAKILVSREGLGDPYFPATFLYKIIPGTAIPASDYIAVK